jgi:hypothetical protein
MFPAIYQSLKIFKLWRDIRVMTANRRSTAWPLSDMCNVTANQRSTGQLSAVQSSSLGWTAAWRRKWLLPFATHGALYTIVGLYNII